MAHYFVALLAVFLFAQPGLSRPEQASSPNIEQLVKEFQTSIDKTIADAKKNLNLPQNPDGAAFVKLFREQADKAEKGYKDIRAKIEDAIKKNPELTNALNNVKAKVDEAEAKLKKDNPELHANARKVVDSIQHVSDALGKEFDKIHAEVNKKGGVRDDLDNILKKIIDDGAALIKDFQAKFQEKKN